MNQNLPVEAVKGIIRDKKERILFLKGSSHKLWDLPGGLIRPGDTHKATLIREIGEETGLIIEVISKPAGKWQFMRLFDKKTVNATNYECRIVDKPFPKIKLSHEHTAYKWLYKRDIIETMIKDPSLLQTL